jgi:hypothetical protein
MSEKITIDRGYFAEQLDVSAKVERERILQIVWETDIKVPKEGLSDRDREAMNYALLQFKFAVRAAIQGESK